MNCKTCKHFGGARAEISGFGDCTRIVPLSELLVRAEAEGENYISKYYNHDGSVFNDPAMTKDGEDYFSVLRVKENFGCVLWEAK
jgi:hypothetical protein